MNARVIVRGMIVLVAACPPTLSLQGCGGGSASGAVRPLNYTVGGNVTGLAAGNAVVLLLNGGTGGSRSVNSNSGFTFLTPVASGSSYTVTVGTQPTGQYCVVSEGSGTVAAADVTSVVVHCPLAEQLWQFGSGMDGQRPYGSLVQGADGNFYGTTDGGGTNFLVNNGFGGGTVFKLTLNGAETVLWNFGGGVDGQGPVAGMIQGTDGNFYGTTYAGGTLGFGVVFMITPTGSETVVWNFGAGADGRNPFGGLIQGSDGDYYGTTYNGGSNGLGTVFKVSTAGVESVLWNFGSGVDGQQPYGNLVLGADGNFYGVTESGGTQGAGTGTVFKLTPAGSESVLWNFGSGSDGKAPVGLIQASDGNFYGTTLAGGSSFGTVFKLTPNGVETVLWDFTGPEDGQQPNSGVIQGQDGDLYGTTGIGGSLGNGNIFKISLAGTETILWAFDGGDGQSPIGRLLQGSDGNFYGTTYSGGAGIGLGTAFKLIP